jgi:hypothetical protein
LHTKHIDASWHPPDMKGAAHLCVEGAIIASREEGAY